MGTCCPGYKSVCQVHCPAFPTPLGLKAASSLSRLHRRRQELESIEQCFCCPAILRLKASFDLCDIDAGYAERMTALKQRQQRSYDLLISSEMID